MTRAQQANEKKNGRQIFKNIEKMSTKLNSRNIYKEVNKNDEM